MANPSQETIPLVWSMSRLNEADETDTDRTGIPTLNGHTAKPPSPRRGMILSALLMIGLMVTLTLFVVSQTRNGRHQTIIVVPDVSTSTSSTYGASPDRSRTGGGSGGGATSASQDESAAGASDMSSTTTTPTVVAYRPQCEYYAIALTDTSIPPHILQTSMHEPSKPWSLKPCVPALNAKTVALNAAGVPDAILQVNLTQPKNNEDQTLILGFGGAFTEASSLNFFTLTESGQEAVLELLFGSSGLGYSLGRVPMHSCDFSVESYTFDDVDADFRMRHFDKQLTHDADTIRMVARAAATYKDAAWNNRPHPVAGGGGAAAADDDNPFRLFASPWSPPAWMKRPTWEDDKHAPHASNMMYSAQPTCLREGTGRHSAYAAAWARYFSHYIDSYQKLSGVDMWAVTVQNEPEFAAPWEACSYTAKSMTDFVAYHLGPTLRKNHPRVKILGFDHNKDHINTWMMTMLNGTTSTSDTSDESDDDIEADDTIDNNSSAIASQYLAGTAYHWYAGGMDRLLDGALGVSNLHQLRENLNSLGRSNDIVLGSEACHCPTTGYAGGDGNVVWDRAERYAHTILADLAAGSQGWVEWNLILDAIGGPNHLGNLCESTLLAVPHRAHDAPADMSPLPEFEQHTPMHGRIFGDERTREELNALGFPAKYLDLGIAVQPMYYYMGHISRHVRPGSISVPGLVRQSLGSAEIFRPLGATVAGGGENDLARDGIELLLWPCEGSTRQQFRWNLDNSKHIAVLGHDWQGNQTKSCVSREVNTDLRGLRLTPCWSENAGSFDLIPIAGDQHQRFLVRLLNHPTYNDDLCLSILELKNGGGSYGPMGGAQVALAECDVESAKWKLDLRTGRASSLYFADDISDNEVCITTGWPFLQMGAFLTPDDVHPKVVVILNEAQDSANYALKNNANVLLTGSIPPRSIQTVLLG